jgi:flagellar hook assembly protein FlgD
LRAWFSEYGSWVTMAAPGVSIRSTIPRTTSTFWPTETNYADGDGTSFSSPLVAGAAALVWARSPGATAAQVRTAVVGTAHGYAGFGLGKGQLDMGRAMAAIVPSTNPTISTPTDAATVTDTVGLTADAGMFGSNIGTKIGWYVDGTRVGFSASGAAFSWDPRGYDESTPHTIQARTCTTAGACASTGSSVSVTLDLPAPTITSPADTATVTGYEDVTVTSPAGGGVAVYAGSTRLGFAPSGTTVEANFTGRDGAHALQAVICNATGTRCAGDRSAVVNVTSSAAGLTRGTVTNAAFSPNGDGVKDTVSVGYTLATAQHVHIEVRNGAGTVVQTILNNGAKAAGSFTVSWNGKAGLLDAPSGTYSLRISSVADAGGATALVTASVRVDRVSPVVTRPAGTATTFYPVVDGFRDTFLPKFTVGETSAVQLVLRNSAGSTVRTITQTVQADKAGTLTWNGRNTAGALVPAGTYTWRVVAVDAAGRKTTTTGRSIAVRRTKLTSRTVTLTKTGDGAYARNPQGCATSVFTGSSYATGFWLKNNCARGNSDIAAGYYRFTVPAAVRYTAFTITSTGRSHSAPADVFGGLYTSQTDNYDITFPARTVPAGATTTRSLTLGTIRSGGRPNAGRVVDVLVFVSNVDRSPLTDWDVKTVSVKVSYQVLA